MIGRMKNGASPQEDDPSRPPDPLNLFDHFVGIQHDQHPPLKPFEVAKLDDLRDDMVWWGDPKTHRPKLSFLGRVFERYEKRWSPPLRLASHEASRKHSAAAPEPRSPAKPFDAEYALLDRLSVWIFRETYELLDR